MYCKPRISWINDIMDKCYMLQLNVIVFDLCNSMHNGNILGKKVLQLFIFRMLNIWLSLIVKVISG